MDIPTVEYEQQRSIFQLCDWVNQKLHALEQTPNFDELYFERRGLNIKKLLEEAAPVAQFGLYLWRPWHDVLVKCLAGNEPHDAEITIQNPRETELIKIEVTSTETDESTMRRQALARDGFVYLTGSVRRVGRQIVSEPEMIDLDQEAIGIMTNAYERFQRKAILENDPQTAILVYVNLYRPFPSRYRSQLLEQTRSYLREHRPTLYGVYYCYIAERGVDGVRNDRQLL